MAIEILNNYDTYGCNAYNGKQHYSGNFWWATVQHLRALSYGIADYYTAPEDYICTKNDKMYCIYSSGHQGGGHYNVEYPEHIYTLPSEFNIDAYRSTNRDLHHLDYNQLINHYFGYGKHEGKNYKIKNKIPDDFSFDYYRNSYSDIKDFTNGQIEWHWHNHGKNENRAYKDNNSSVIKYNMPEDFNFDFYRNNYDDMKDFTDGQIAWHWDTFGKNENRAYK
jgi:hypothetical protein